MHTQWSAPLGRDSKTTDRVAVLMDELAAWALRKDRQPMHRVDDQPPWSCTPDLQPMCLQIPVKSAGHGPRGAVNSTAGSAGRATQELWGTQALFDRPALQMAL